MTTQEAYAAMQAKYPGEKVRVTHWIDSEGETFGVSVGDATDPNRASAYSDSHEAAMAKLIVPSKADRAAAIRAQAQALLDEAAKLEK